jgi:hypothetical protein
MKQDPNHASQRNCPENGEIARQQIIDVFLGEEFE